MSTRFDKLFVAHHSPQKTAKDLLAAVEATSYQTLEEWGLYNGGGGRVAFRKLRQEQRLKAAEGYVQRMEVAIALGPTLAMADGSYTTEISAEDKGKVEGAARGALECFYEWYKGDILRPGSVVRVKVAISVDFGKGRSFHTEESLDTTPPAGPVGTSPEDQVIRRCIRLTKRETYCGRSIGAEWTFGVNAAMKADGRKGPNALVPCLAGIQALVLPHQRAKDTAPMTWERPCQRQA
jgi:hypothetical protein